MLETWNEGGDEDDDDDEGQDGEEEGAKGHGKPVTEREDWWSQEELQKNLEAEKHKETKGPLVDTSSSSSSSIPKEEEPK